jgi:hypothetical protein
MDAGLGASCGPRKGEYSGQIAERTDHSRSNRRQSATALTGRKEVPGLTAILARPPIEEALPEAEESLAPDLYEAPFAEVEHVERETESYVLWIIVLGFVAYALALYWAHRCHRRGGDPQITFSVLKGFIVKCRK